MMEEQTQDEQNTDGVHGLTWRRGAMIGNGSFGSVYLATSKEGRLSPFPPQMAVKSAEFSVSTSLRKERRLLSYLYGSPYIIKCFGDEITTGEKVYNLLLEYASGGSLHDLKKKLGDNGLPETEVRRYARSILRGIKHDHDRGCVHLDIKPANILLVAHSSGTDSTKFKAKLCDFGMARAIKPKKPSRNVRGTAMYLSPEAVVQGKQDASADIWAIGCVVLEMLTGKRVWDRQDHWNTDDFILKIGHYFGTPEIPIGISDEGKEFLNGCFVRRVEDRLTADMLLKLPFISQLGDDDDDDGDEEIETESLDAQGVGPVVSLTEIEDDDDESGPDKSGGEPEEDQDPSEPPKEEDNDEEVAELEELEESDNHQLPISNIDNDNDSEEDPTAELDLNELPVYSTETRHPPLDLNESPISSSETWQPPLDLNELPELDLNGSPISSPKTRHPPLDLNESPISSLETWHPPLDLNELPELYLNWLPISTSETRHPPLDLNELPELDLNGSRISLPETWDPSLDMNELPASLREEYDDKGAEMEAFNESNNQLPISQTDNGCDIEPSTPSDYYYSETVEDPSVPMKEEEEEEEKEDDEEVAESEQYRESPEPTTSSEEDPSMCSSPEAKLEDVNENGDAEIEESRNGKLDLQETSSRNHERNQKKRIAGDDGTTQDHKRRKANDEF